MVSVVFSQSNESYRRNADNANARVLGSESQGSSSRRGVLGQMGYSREVGRGSHLERLSGAWTNLQPHQLAFCPRCSHSDQRIGNYP